MLDPNGATQTNPQETEEVQALPGQEIPQQEGDFQAVEETQPKLFAGKYKTPEELEEAYTNSNREATRMAQELKRLNAVVQQIQSKPVNQQKPTTGFESFFDDDTREAIKWYIQNALAEFAQSQKSQTAFERQVTEVWENTKRDYPEVADPQSELYQLADKLLMENGLATYDQNGQLVLMTPHAYRIAVEAAYAQLAKKAPETQEAGMKKNRAVAVQGKTTRTIPTGKLTLEQYNKLPDEEKDRYDAQQAQQLTQRR